MPRIWTNLVNANVNNYNNNPTAHTAITLAGTFGAVAVVRIVERTLVNRYNDKVEHPNK